MLVSILRFLVGDDEALELLETKTRVALRQAASDEDSSGSGEIEGQLGSLIILS
jgi:hypothetical protein